MEKTIVETLIENNIKLINDNQWDKVYDELHDYADGHELWEAIGLFTEKMYIAGIDPLQHIKSVPPQFLYGYIGGYIKDDFYIPNHIENIFVEAFSLSETIKTIHLPKNLKYIGMNAFGFSDITTLIYPGTFEEFTSKIKFGDDWSEGTYIEEIKCSDGVYTSRDLLKKGVSISL